MLLHVPHAWGSELHTLQRALARAQPRGETHDAQARHDGTRQLTYEYSMLDDGPSDSLGGAAETPHPRRSEAAITHRRHTPHTGAPGAPASPSTQHNMHVDTGLCTVPRTYSTVEQRATERGLGLGTKPQCRIAVKGHWCATGPEDCNHHDGSHTHMDAGHSSDSSTAGASKGATGHRQWKRLLAPD